MNIDTAFITSTLDVAVQYWNGFSGIIKFVLGVLAIAFVIKLAIGAFHHKG